MRSFLLTLVNHAKFFEIKSVPRTGTNFFLSIVDLNLVPNLQQLGLRSKYRFEFPTYPNKLSLNQWFQECSIHIAVAKCTLKMCQFSIVDAIMIAKKWTLSKNIQESKQTGYSKNRTSSSNITIASMVMVVLIDGRLSVFRVVSTMIKFPFSIYLAVI